MLEYFTKIEVTPSYIRSYESLESHVRLYPVGYELIFPFLPIFYIYKKWVAFFFCFFIIGYTGGKTGFAMLVVTFIFLMVKVEKNLRKKLSIFSCGLLVSLIIYLGIETRIDDLYESGDSRRFEQIYDAYDTIIQKPANLLYGAGLGTQYSEGYMRFSDSIYNENIRLMDNSMYDIENGYIYLLVRLGVPGAILFLISIFYRIGYLNLYFILYLLINWMAGSTASPSSLMSFILFGISAGLLRKKFGK